MEKLEEVKFIYFFCMEEVSNKGVFDTGSYF